MEPLSFKCKKHDGIEHADYGDKGHVCAFCVFETAEQLLPSADRILAAVREKLINDQWDKFEKLVEDGKTAGFSFGYASMIVIARKLYLLASIKQAAEQTIDAEAILRNLDSILLNILYEEDKAQAS